MKEKEGTGVMVVPAYEVEKTIEIVIKAKSYAEVRNQTTGETRMDIDTGDYEITMEIKPKVKDNE